MIDSQVPIGLIGPVNITCQTLSLLFTKRTRVFTHMVIRMTSRLSPRRQSTCEAHYGRGTVPRVLYACAQLVFVFLVHVEIKRNS